MPPHRRTTFHDGSTADLFAEAGSGFPSREVLAPGACILRDFALPHASDLLKALAPVVLRAPFRHLITPGGFTMSVGMTNCGALGWVSDRRAYRYASNDPQTNLPWPPMPVAFQQLAVTAAAVAGFDNFSPDACLINRYVPGARLTLHQDRNERDLAQPIVSVSLGVPATFLFGGLSRTDQQVRVGLFHGDVVVWGGTSRLNFHGILPLKASHHPATGGCRLNLTFRTVR